MSDLSNLGGWVDDPGKVEDVIESLPMPYFSMAAPGLFESETPETVLLYKAFKDVLGSYPAYPAQAIGDCFVAGTTVLGEKIQPIEKVQVGDKVWTGEGNLTEVVSVRSMETFKPIVRVRSVGGMPITCTADHKLLVYRMARVGGHRVSATCYARAEKGSLANKKNAAIVSCYESREPEWVAAEDLTDTDFLLSPTRIEQIQPPDDKFRHLWDDPEWRRLLGFFLGDGHASGGSVEFAVSDIEDQNLLVRACEKAGFNPKIATYRPGCGAWRVRIHNRELVRWLRSVFYDSDSVKSFPGWAVGDSEFLAGLKDADGFDMSGERPGCYGICSTSPSIINGAMASLISLGYSPTVLLQSRSKGTYANAKPIWRITWYAGEKERNVVWRDEQFMCRPVRKVDRIEGPMTVYDIGVADSHHSFIANAQSVHNCVSQGFAHGVDLLACIEIAIGKEPEAFKYTSTEAVYGMARVDIGRGQLGNSDGAVGAWAAKAISTLGTVSREVAGEYSGSRAKSWGRSGVPAEFKQVALNHKVKTVSLVTNYDELEAAIANGYPIPVCSNQGFTMVRDADGFCRASGSWAHCMLIVGIRGGNRPGACIMQSWGPNTPSGPLALDQPNNTFWADKDVVARMLAARDSWAISSFDGYPGRPMPSKWSYSAMA